MVVNVKKLNGQDLIKITNGDFEVILSDLAASIFAIKLDGKFMTQSLENPDLFLKLNYYHGKTIGRVCNRLPGNKIVIDNKTYEIENNEGENTLHGGINSISSKRFQYEIENNKENVKVIFKCFSKDGEAGFPGNMNIKVIYTISGSSVLIEFEANTDKKTMCSLTNHAFYACGEESLSDLELMIASKRFLHPDKDDLLPLDIRNVDEIMDFSNFKQVTKDIDAPYLLNSKTYGYDHYYYFDDIDNNKIQVSLRGKRYQLDITTDFSGTQIYSDNYPSNDVFSNSKYNRRRGIAIEPSESQKDLHYLDKNQVYKHFINLTFNRR